MPEISCLSGCSGWIDLDFVERERTPESAMELGIQSHVAGLSLANTVDLLESLGVERSRKTIHDWVQKTDLQPESDKNPNHVALDETVIRINDQQYWLYAAADPQSNDLLHLRLFSTTTTALTEMFLELREKHDVETAVFLVDHAQHLQTALQRVGLRFQTRRHGNRMPSNGFSANSSAVPHPSQTASATSNQKLPNHGSKPSLAGTTHQTKHRRV